MKVAQLTIRSDLHTTTVHIQETDVPPKSLAPAPTKRAESNGSLSCELIYMHNVQVNLLEQMSAIKWRHCTTLKSTSADKMTFWYVFIDRNREMSFLKISIELVWLASKVYTQLQTQIVQESKVYALFCSKCQESIW